MKRPVTPRGGAWQRMLDVLSKKPGAVVPNKVLFTVAGQLNYSRRLRELIADGWKISYSHKENGYVLGSLEKKSGGADTYVNLKLRHKVLTRDRYTCLGCGYKGGEKYPDGKTVRLEADHIISLKKRGPTVEENLGTLCTRCNAGKKALYEYPETIKNKILTLNLPDALRTRITKTALKSKRTVNEVVLDAITKGLK